MYHQMRTHSRLCYQQQPQLRHSTSGQKILALKPSSYALKKIRVTYTIASVAFSTDSQRLASLNNDGTWAVWDALNGQEIFKQKQYLIQISTQVSCVSTLDSPRH